MGVIAALFIVIAGLFIVIASPEGVAISEKQNSKIKGQNDRAKFKSVVRGFSLVHDPEGSRYKRRACLALTRVLRHYETLPLHFIQGQGDKRGIMATFFYCHWGPFYRHCEPLFIVIATFFYCHCEPNIWQSP